MPKILNLGYKECLNCGDKIKLSITRDLMRKKFCSRSCSTKYYSLLGVFNNKGKRFSKEWRMNISKAKKKIGSWRGENNPNYKGAILTGRKASEYMKEVNRIRMKNGGAAIARKACGGKKSSIQVIVENYLSSINIKFEPEKIINNHAVDIFVSPNICIECDGDYWHSLPEQVLRDLEFNNYCNDNNFVLIRLKEKDIRSNIFENFLTTKLKLYATSSNS